MDARQVRTVLPMLYAVAIVAVVLFHAGGTAIAAVAIVGAMVLGAFYTALARHPGTVSTRPERAARRARRTERRGL